MSSTVLPCFDGCGDVQAHRAVLRSDPGSGSRKPLWRTPVRCRITGGPWTANMQVGAACAQPAKLYTKPTHQQCICICWLGLSVFFIV
jgi:hypothetical protein